jgi:hypothetical protein
MTQPPDLDWQDLTLDQPPPDPWGDTTWAESAAPGTDSEATDTTRPTSSPTATAPAVPPTTTSGPTPPPPPPPPPTPPPGRVTAPGRTAADVERDRVLRHPDIAARLCDPPLRYSRPENWTGYVPPETWQGKRNDAPQRTQLLDIITAAVKREKEAQGV